MQAGNQDSVHQSLQPDAEVTVGIDNEDNEGI